MMIVAIADSCDQQVGLCMGVKADILLCCGNVADGIILKAIERHRPEICLAVRGGGRR